MRSFVVCLALAGCASAGKGNSIIGGIDDAGIDGNDIPGPDASPIDASPKQAVLSQTTSEAITLDNSLACLDRAMAMLPNSYYRVFTLADHNITSTLHVSQVDFAIQTATAGGGLMTQDAVVRLGTYGAAPQGTTLDLAQIRELASVDIKIPNGSGTRMTVPIAADVAPTARLIVELEIPDGVPTGNKFFIGTNAQGERKPGYLRAPDCGFGNPTTMASVATEAGFSEPDLILTVTGMQ